MRCKPVPPRRVLRRLLPALLLPVMLLASCAEDTAPARDYPPLTYDYLTKLRLNVATIDVDDSWTPRGGSRQVGSLSPASPLDALRHMGQDRLVAIGSTGRATYVIDDASVIQTRDGLQGSFAVHLDVTTSDGARAGYAEARVSRVRTLNDDAPETLRGAVYDLIRQMMDDMNVEFEFQLRRTLRDYIERGGSGTDTAPSPAPVQSQDLNPPAGVTAAPAPPPDAVTPPAPSAPQTPGGPIVIPTGPPDAPTPLSAPPPQ